MTPTPASRSFDDALRVALDSLVALRDRVDEAPREVQVVLRVPGEEHPLCARLSWPAAERRQVRRVEGRFHTGPDGYATARTYAGLGTYDDDLQSDSEQLGFSFQPRDEVPDEWRRVVRSADFPGKSWPFVFVKQRGMAPVLPGARELEVLAYAARGIVAALDAKLVSDGNVSFPDPGPVTAFDVAGDLEARDGVAVRPVSLELATDRPLREVSVEAPTRLANLAREPEGWVVRWGPLPRRVPMEPRFPRFVAIARAGAAEPIGDAAIDVQKAADVVFEAMLGLRGISPRLPEAIVFMSRSLHAACAPHLEPLGVACKFSPPIPRPQADDEEDTAPPPVPIPAEGDAEGWEDASNALTRRVDQHFERAGGTSRKAITAFFGDAEIGTTLMQVSAIAAAYSEWFLTHYRAKPRRRTLAEALLAGPLPEAERMVLEAKVAAQPTIFEILAAGDRRVTIRCLASGEQFEVPGTVQTDRTGLHVVGRAFRVGAFTLFDALGPELNTAEHADLLDPLRGDDRARMAARFHSTPSLPGMLWLATLERFGGKQHKRDAGEEGESERAATT